jgi:two-component sensor histidine kinase/PAS domain-containing protein
LKKAGQDLKHAEEVNRVLFSISNAINTTLNLDELYASIRASLMQIIDVSNFYIALYHKHKNSITFPYYVDEVDHSASDYPEIQDIQGAHSVTGEVIRRGEPLLLTREQLIHFRMIGTLSQVWLGVPLKLKNETIGVMVVQSYRNPRQYDAEDIDILMSVSDQVAIAIDRKRTQEALKRSESRFRNLIEDLDAITYSANQDGFFTYISPAVESITGYRQEEIAGTASDELNPLERQVRPTRWLRFDLKEEKAGGPLFEALIHPDDREAVSAAIRAALSGCRPYKVEYRLRKQNGHYGWVYEKGMVLDHGQENRRIEGVILDIHERKHAEEINQALFGISNAVNTTFNLDELYASIRGSLKQIVDTTNFFIYLYNERDDILTFAYHKSENNEFAAFGNPVIVKASDWSLLSMVVIKAGKPLLLNQDEMERLDEKEGKPMFGAPCEAWLGVPLKIKGNGIGIMGVQSFTDPDRFTDKDIDILMSVCDQVAIAIDRKRSQEALETEVAERKRMEKQIKSSLKEKEILLREIHHRVKNNMQIISSLLNLQSRYIKDQALLEVFRESCNRVKSMATIHEKLYQSQDLVKIDTQEYIKSLVDNLYRSYGVDPEIIAPEIRIENVFLGIDLAIPCGLIVNELVSNSLKHGFPPLWKGQGKIQVAFQSNSKGRILLTVRDNGAGMPKNVDMDAVDTLGLRLVSILVRDQLGGEIRLRHDGGTRYEIEFSSAGAEEDEKEIPASLSGYQLPGETSAQ